MTKEMIKCTGVDNEVMSWQFKTKNDNTYTGQTEEETTWSKQFQSSPVAGNITIYFLLNLYKPNIL